MNYKNKIKIRISEKIDKLCTLISIGKKIFSEKFFRRNNQEREVNTDSYKSIFEHSNDAIFVYDINNGNILAVNHKGSEMFEINYEPFVGINNRYFHPYSNEELKYWIKKTITDGPQLFECQSKNKWGNLFWIEVNFELISINGKSFIIARIRDITNRKLLEQELVTTKNYLKIVLNNMHDAIFIHDLEGKVIDINMKTLEMYDITREETIDSHIIPDYSAPYYSKDELYSIWKKVVSGENQFFEWKAKRPKDGYIFDVEVFLTKVSLPDGEFILANVRDITERKNMEKQLLEEREVFFSVMENNPHGIALFDNNGTFLYLNPEFTAITGYTLKDIPNGREWIKKAYPDLNYREEVIKFWKSDRIPKGRGKDVEWIVTCKDGKKKYLEFRVTYLGDKSLVVLTDVTARKQIEIDMLAEKQKFQTLTESSPMGMIMIGADDCIKYVNPKFEELFGYSLQDIPNISKWFMYAYPDPNYQMHVRKNWRDDLKILSNGEGSPYVRLVTCKDGSKKYINLVPVKLKTGEILITCEDITKNKEAEDKIKERNIELEALNDLIASVSSSLNMPEILQTLKKVFVEKLRINAGGIFFYNEISEKLEMEMSWGISETNIEEFESFVLNRYNTETTIHNNDVVLIKNHIDNLRSNTFLLSKFVKKWDIHLYILLVAKGEIQGLAVLIDNKFNKLSENDVSFYRALGQQIGVAIQKARLFDQVNKSNIQMKALSLKLVEVQEAERRYIARELHDEIGQRLTGLKFALEVGAMHPKIDNIIKKMEEAKTSVNDLIEIVRELSLKLRPAMLDDLGLFATLPWHFERFAKQTNINIIFMHQGLKGRRFPVEIETTIFRIVQEALTNVARHAKVDEAIVRVWLNEKIIGVQIEDRGVGFIYDDISIGNRTSGLCGMRERAMLLGGTFVLETCPGCGTRITAEIPLKFDEKLQ